MSSLNPGSTSTSTMLSGPLGGSTYGFGIVTITSGLPMYHWLMSANWRGAGMSAMLPFGAPLSTHLVIVAISSSVSDGSSLNLVMPTFRSMCHGGISRLATFWRIERAHGRASSNVRSDIGAIAPGRWQF
jgi:hypothetical protein